MVDQGTGGKNPTNPVIEMKRGICRAIADADDAAFMDINTLRDDNNNAFSDVLPNCPRTRVRLDLSPLFQDFDTQPGDCFRSNDVYTPTTIEGFQFVSVCCYDANNG